MLIGVACALQLAASAALHCARYFAHACGRPATGCSPRHNHARRWVAVNEVRLLASLHHPNVVQYKQCFVEDNCLYVIMEVVPNGELAAVAE